MSILQQPCTSTTDIKILADTDKPIINFHVMAHKWPILKFYTMMCKKNRKIKQEKIKKVLNASSKRYNKTYEIPF